MRGRERVTHWSEGLAPLSGGGVRLADGLELWSLSLANWPIHTLTCLNERGSRPRLVDERYD